MVEPFGARAQGGKSKARIPSSKGGKRFRAGSPKLFGCVQAQT